MAWSQIIKPLAKRKEDKKSISSFEGESGEKRLLEVVLRNLAISGDENIARQLLAVGELKQFDRGETMIQQGHSDDDVYVLIIGDVEIVTKGQKLAIRRSPAQVGEMAAITPGQNRTASVVVRSDEVVALKIAGSDYRDIWKSNTEFSQRLQVELSARMEERINAGKVERENSALLWTFISIGLAAASAFACYFTFDFSAFEESGRILVSALAGLVIFIIAQLLNPAYIYRRLIGVLIAALVGKIWLERPISFSLESDLGDASATIGSVCESSANCFGGWQTDIIIIIAIAVLAVRDWQVARK